MIVGTLHRNAAVMGTLWDFLGMRPREWVFFFRDRQVKGIGRTVRLPGSRTVALQNWPGSEVLQAYTGAGPVALDQGSNSTTIPWIVPFEPLLGSETGGVDMDELLQSEVSGVLRALPLFSGVSFLKLGSD